ncbi:hypothetical protein B7463_g6307, partial [Scytalidium lignicola]
MAKTKPNKKKSKTREKSALNRVAANPSNPSSPPTPPAQLLAQATAALQQGDIEGSVPFAKRALDAVDSNSAASLDEDGTVAEDVGGGPEKFFWLAQLSEDGREDSVNWFEKGAKSLRIQIQALLDQGKSDDEAEAALEEKRKKLALALCSVTEVYMTDLSWEEDAEQRCEALVTEATMVAPGYPEPWQTLANVRISQERLEDATAALRRSLDIWKGLPTENPLVPDFPTRVSLARLLMETDMDTEAIEVLERLVNEDDSSVEVWYLGGWALYVMGEKLRNGERAEKSEMDGESWKVSWISSRQWLTQSLRLFELQDYEDERLGEHARELMSILNKELGEMGSVDVDGDDDDDEWEDDEESNENEDEVMVEA